ncbi:MAG: hypothetical protein GY953_19620 [bacterium]|nr:hypothetical protein [bacterium]
MSYKAETPFDSIEDTQQFVELLLEVIKEAQQEVATDLSASSGSQQARRTEALRLVAHNLDRLSFHVTRSRRLLNDLRMLRRLLAEERQTARAAGAD